MMKTLKSVLAISFICYSLSAQALPTTKDLAEYYHQILTTLSISIAPTQSSKTETEKPLDDIKAMFQREASTLNTRVVDKVMASLQCSDKYHVPHNRVLTVIDYSRPSNEKRLWVFDLQQKKMLFHTYVSHGIKSGALMSDYFSNKNNSKASSIGVYTTEKTYYGRDGLSLRLNGLDKGFNNNAFNRYIVMHGSWYVDEAFIKKYGRPGRSWGCPALPSNITSDVINAIKDNSLFVTYYPNEAWLSSSKFLLCEHPSLKTDSSKNHFVSSDSTSPETRDDILFVDLNHNNQREENEPVVVISADNYQAIFHQIAPLERMLRRQINHSEYVALTQNEFKQIAGNRDSLAMIRFVIPVVTMQRGNYITEMRIIPIKNKDTLSLKSTKHFIRWLGL